MREEGMWLRMYVYLDTGYDESTVNTLSINVEDNNMIPVPYNWWIETDNSPINISGKRQNFQYWQFGWLEVC